MLNIKKLPESSLWGPCLRLTWTWHRALLRDVLSGIWPACSWSLSVPLEPLSERCVLPLIHVCPYSVRLSSWEHQVQLSVCSFEPLGGYPVSIVFIRTKLWEQSHCSLFKFSVLCGTVCTLNPILEDSDHEIFCLNVWKFLYKLLVLFKN